MKYSARTIRIVFFAAITILLSISVVLYLGIRNLIDSYYWVNHTWEVEYKVQKVYAGLKNAESSVRGYVLSDDSTYLDEKKAFEAALPQWLNDLGYLVRDNPQQVKRMQQLVRLINERIHILDGTLALYRRGISDEQMQERLKMGRRTMDNIQVIATAMYKQESDLLTEREQTRDKYVRNVPIYLVMLTLVLLILLILIFNHLQRQLKTLQTTQHKLQEFNTQLEQKGKALESSNEELESFNYIASHDLKEPLRKIGTFASMIQQEDSDRLSEKGKHHFSRLQASAKRMQLLLDDLLAYTRLKSTTETFRKVDLGQVVQQVQENLQEVITESGATVESNNLPVVNGVPFQLHQLMENMLSNAVKYRRKDVLPKVVITSMPVYPTELVELTGTKEQPYHCITIEDNGLGFPQEYAQKVFDIFTRLHNDATLTGTGVGLTICKKIVENHNGFIRVESTPGVGTKFFVYLPQ